MGMDPEILVSFMIFMFVMYVTASVTKIDLHTRWEEQASSGSILGPADPAFAPNKQVSSSTFFMHVSNTMITEKMKGNTCWDYQGHHWANFPKSQGPNDPDVHQLTY